MWEKAHLPLEPLIRDEGQFFFGYYDLNAMRGNVHLAHKAPFADRLQQKDDSVLLGTASLNGGGFTPFDETRAWCFQEGAMLQYLPDGRVLYNIKTPHGFGARTRDLKTGKTTDYPLPAATVARDGAFYLSINFSRQYDFRPGYGYAGHPDPFKKEKAPAQDGIFRVDLKTKQVRLIVSTMDLSTVRPGYFPEGDRLCVNHTTLSPGGKRAIVLLRNMDHSPWRTLTLTVDADTGEIFVLHEETMMSHYWWEDDERLLAFCQLNGIWNMRRLTDRTRSAEEFDRALFGEDGHMRIKGDYLTYDSYPDREGRRFLGLYHLPTGRGWETARVLGPTPSCVDIRTDLHPRWHPDKNLVTIDSIHEGRRNIYLQDLSPLAGGSI